MIHCKWQHPQAYFTPEELQEMEERRLAERQQAERRAIARELERT